MTAYHAPWAWLPTGPAADVRLLIEDGRITQVRPGVIAGPDDVRLPGLVLPGFADTHSHAFHRALRGRVHGPGDFWAWRQAMYAVAGRLDPDRYRLLARAVFAELVLAGVSCVGEFHYVHHRPDGRPYGDPNAMGAALIEAAAEAGLRITLLDTCYLAGGLGPDGPLPLADEQRRFGDATVSAWAERVAGLRPADHARIGAAVHSVRAVARGDLPVIAGFDGPVHVHLSEQPAENEQCRAAYGCTPTELLDGSGLLGPRTTAVHATHLAGSDIARLGSSGTAISMCPTTERDLADGIGPARALRDAGAPITLGSDQNVVIDLLEEARALEMDERLASGRRGCFSPAELLEALTSAGHKALGWPDAGRLVPGARADLTVLRLDSVRTAGTAPEQAFLAAGAADVDTVIIDGVVVVQEGRHGLGDVGALLTAAITPLWAE